MRFFIAIFLFFLFVSSKAQTSEIHAALIKVNPEWLNYELTEAFLSKGFVPRNEHEAVKHHLMMAEKFLNEKYINNKKALKLLNEHHNYWQNDLFPKNYEISSRNPCFIDHHGTLCAVANLMYATGDSALAHTIHKTENYAFVKTMTTPGVKAWISKSGLSKNDLALIQPGYEAPIPEPKCGNGIDSTSRHFGHTRYTCQCKNGLPHGTWKVYDDWGQLRQSGLMMNGKKQGKWLTYSYNVAGQKNEPKPRLSSTLIEHYKDGLLHGDLIIKGINNKIHHKASFNMGHIEGDYEMPEAEYQDYYKRSYVKLKNSDKYRFIEVTKTDSTVGDMKNNSCVGIWKSYDLKTGKLKTKSVFIDTAKWEVNFKSAMRRYEFFRVGYNYNDLLSEKKYENGTLKSFISYDESFSKDGYVFSTHTNRNVGPQIAHFVHNQLEGPLYILVPNNSKSRIGDLISDTCEVCNDSIFYSVSEIHPYKNNSIHGIKKVFDKEIEYHTEFMHGTRNGTYFQIQGKDTLVYGSFKDGEKHGAWKARNYDNSIKYEENYQNGILHGHQLYYNQEKQLINHVVYDNGKKVKFEEQIGFDGVMIRWCSLCGYQKCEEKFYHNNGKVKRHLINYNSGILKQEIKYNPEGEVVSHYFNDKKEIDTILGKLKTTNSKFATWCNGWDEINGIELSYNQKKPVLKIYGKIGSKLEGHAILNSKSTKVKSFKAEKLVQ